MIIVNLGTSAGLEIHQWECDKVACDQVSFEAKGSGNSLLQLLVLTNSQNITEVNYGQEFRSLKSGDNVFQISLQKVADFSQEAQIMGRYIPSNGHSLQGKKLTGNIHLSVQVPDSFGDVPDMEIMKREIFAGWFQTFALNSLGFRYRFRGFDETGNFHENVEVFNDLHDGKGLKIGSAGLQSSGFQRVSYSLSAPVYEEEEGAFLQKNFQGKIIGFFGDNSDNQRLCSEALSGATVFDGSNGRSSICKSLSGSNCGSYFSWSEIQKNGSLDGSSETCSANPGALEVDLEDVGDRDDLIDVYGPFTANSATGVSEAIEISAAGVLSWNFVDDLYLPHGVDVFLRTTKLPDDSVVKGRDDDLLCDRLEENGFSLIASLSSTENSIDLISNGANQNSQVALCLKQSVDRYYNFGFLSNDENTGGHSSPTQIHIAKISSIDGFSGKVNQNVCVPFLIELRDENNNRSHSDSSVSINLNSGNASNYFYKDLGDCETNTTGNAVTALSINRDDWIYFRTNNNSGSYNVVASDSSGQLTAGQFGLTAQTAASVANVALAPDWGRNPGSKEAATTEGCVGFRFVAFDSDGELTLMGVSDNANLSGSGRFYHNGDCATAPVGSIGTSGIAHQLVYFNVPSTPQTVSSTMGSCNPSCSGNNDVQVVNPGAYDHWHPEVDGKWEVGECVRIRLTAYDDHQPNSYPTNFPSGDVFGYANNSADGGLLIDDSLNLGGTAPDGYECDDVVESDLIINQANLGDPTGQTHRLLYYLPNLVDANQNAIDLSFTYAGQSKNVQSPIGQGNRGYLLVPASYRPYLDFGTVSNAVGDSQSVSFINRGNTSLSSITSHNDGEFSFGAGGSCSATLGGYGSSCNKDLEFSTGANGSYSGRIYWKFDNGGSGFRKVPIFVKGVRN